MARLNSFFLPPEAWCPPYSLDGDEARHLAKVLRHVPGDTVRLFDGRGREGLFAVTRVKGGVEFALLSESFTPRPAPEVWLAPGFNKSSRRGWLLEKAVELGAAGIFFWEAERGQGGMPDAPKLTWRAQMTAGAKQCGNPWLPEIETVPGGAGGLIERCGLMSRRFLLHESPDAGRPLVLPDLTDIHPALFVLGPEGGLTDAEANRFLRSGYEAVTLGNRPLRFETAALLALGLCWWGGQAADNPDTNK
jgi:16S rRNA (uracil1498-N3)-methyltransferase